MAEVSVWSNIGLSDYEKGMVDVINIAEEIRNALYTTAKEKYDCKSRLIENATDMSTQEKLVAHNQNYDQLVSEVWQGIIALASAASLIYLMKNPNVIRVIRRMAK